MFEKLKTFFNHQRYQIISVLVFAVVIVIFYGCEAKVSSFNSPTRRIDRDELDTEVELFLARAQNKYSNLNRQEQFRQLLFENALSYAQGVPINPIGIFTSLAALFGVGATVDNVRRRKTEKKLKAIIDDNSN